MHNTLNHWQEQSALAVTSTSHLLCSGTIYLTYLTFLNSVLLGDLLSLRTTQVTSRKIETSSSFSNIQNWRKGHGCGRNAERPEAARQLREEQTRKTPSTLRLGSQCMKTESVMLETWDQPTLAATAMKTAHRSGDHGRGPFGRHWWKLQPAHHMNKKRCLPSLFLLLKSWPSPTPLSL